MTNPFICGPPVFGDNFINRDNIILKINNLFKSSIGNILIFGIRRIGKTSLCLHLSKSVSKDRSILVGYLSTEIIPRLEPELFIQHILLEIISVTALSLFSKKYSDLLFDLQSSCLLEKDYGRLLRIFELVRSAERTSEKSFKKDLGISWLMKGGVEQNRTNQSSINELKSFEALLLMQEIIDILKCNDINKFVLIIDEANKLTLQANEWIIREILSLFSFDGLQFCFVTTPDIVESVPEVDELFKNKVEIGPFENSGLIKLLIKQYQLKNKDEDSKINFSDDAIDLIWKSTKGVPLFVQLLCSKCFDRASSNTNFNIDKDNVVDILFERDIFYG